MKKVTKARLDYVKTSYVDTLVNTIGRKRALLVLLQLEKHNKLGFSGINDKLGGISPSTLSSLLRDLGKERLIKKRVLGTVSPRLTEYSLTKNGQALLDAIDPLIKWVCKSRK